MTKTKQQIIYQIEEDKSNSSAEQDNKSSNSSTAISSNKVIINLLPNGNIASITSFLQPDFLACLPNSFFNYEKSSQDDFINRLNLLNALACWNERYSNLIVSNNSNIIEIGSKLDEMLALGLAKINAKNLKEHPFPLRLRQKAYYLQEKNNESANNETNLHFYSNLILPFYDYFIKNDKDYFIIMVDVFNHRSSLANNENNSKGNPNPISNANLIKPVLSKQPDFLVNPFVAFAIKNELFFIRTSTLLANINVSQFLDDEVNLVFVANNLRQNKPELFKSLDFNGFNAFRDVYSDVSKQQNSKNVLIGLNENNEFYLQLTTKISKTAFVSNLLKFLNEELNKELQTTPKQEAKNEFNFTYTSAILVLEAVRSSLAVFLKDDFTSFKIIKTFKDSSFLDANNISNLLANMQNNILLATKQKASLIIDALKKELAKEDDRLNSLNSNYHPANVFSASFLAKYTNKEANSVQEKYGSFKKLVNKVANILITNNLLDVKVLLQEGQKEQENRLLANRTKNNEPFQDLSLSLPVLENKVVENGEFLPYSKQEYKTLFAKNQATNNTISQIKPVLVKTTTKTATFEVGSLPVSNARSLNNQQILQNEASNSQKPTSNFETRRKVAKNNTSQNENNTKFKR